MFTLQSSGVQITLEYLSPIEPGDLQRQSIPMAWVLVTAQSIDGASHDVSLYLDVTGEWLSGDPSQPFTWAPVSVPYRGGALQAWTMQLAEQQILTEIDDRAQWGTIILATPQIPGLSYQSGPSGTVRTQFVDQGVLLDTDDTSYTSIGGDGYPSFGFALDLGQVGSQPQTRQFSLGQVRTPLVSYLGTPLQPLWTEYFSDWQRMLAFFHADIAGARQRADTLDAKVSADARKAGGAEYEALCVLSLRQAYGATELAVGPDNLPWAFLKEISSDGDTSTVDVIFPASPVWIYLDPQYLSLLLRPIFGYAASGRWTARFAPHDLGPYPTASGYPHNGGENMPVEESGNMIIMAAAYTRAAPGTTALVYLQANYRWLKRWADYLVATLPDPGLQNQTDDFAGKIAHSVNLALKGIVAVAAMGQIAEACGEQADAIHYRTQGQAVHRLLAQTRAGARAQPPRAHLSPPGQARMGNYLQRLSRRTARHRPRARVGRGRAGGVLPDQDQPVRAAAADSAPLRQDRLADVAGGLAASLPDQPGADRARVPVCEHDPEPRSVLRSVQHDHGRSGVRLPGPAGAGRNLRAPRAARARGPALLSGGPAPKRHKRSRPRSGRGSIPRGWRRDADRRQALQ